MTRFGIMAFLVLGLLTGGLLACDEGFKVVVDGSADAARDAGQEDGPSALDAPVADGPDPPPGCVALKRSLGPLSLGFGEAYSADSALAVTLAGIAAVWEGVHYDTGRTYFAVVDPGGEIVVPARLVDESDYAPAPAIVAVGDGFGVLHTRDAANPRLVYQRLDSSGEPLKTTQLATNPGGYISSPAVASGPAGIAVGYVRHAADKRGAVHLGRIDEHGALTVPFGLASAAETWNVALLATGDGFLAAWVEARDDCWALVVARLDSALQQVAPPTVIADQAGCYQHPSMALLGDDLMVCAERVPPEGNTVIVCRLLDRDLVARGEETVSSLAGLSSRRPRVVAGGGGFAVLWTGKTTGLEEVHARLFSASGEPLGAPQRISEDGVRSFYPAAVWTDDGLFAAWYRYVPITVYYAAFALTCEAP